MIKTNLFPGGVRRALTLSYDDGQIFDVRLASLFDKYHMKATFHLNSGNLGKEGYVKENVLSQLYRRHEVSVHTVTHPFPTQIPDAELRREIVEDKRRLEELCGYPVRGMSYPFGDYSEHAICVARSCGMEYSRTVEDTGRFAIPQDFMKWHPTTHHNGDLEGLWKRFMVILKKCCSFMSGGTALSSTARIPGIRWKRSVRWQLTTKMSGMLPTLKLRIISQR